jgi:Ca2+-transporting ATPase
MVVAAASSLLLLALYVPWLAGLFKFEQLPALYLAAAVGLGLASIVWFELVKPRQAGAVPTDVLLK